MRRFLLLLVSFYCCVSPSRTEDDFQSWVNDPRYSLYPTLPNIAPRSQDEVCRTDSQAFLSELKNKTLWAMKMWDSSAKSPVGVFSGSIFHLGNFDECLKISAPFPVQFCVAHVSANVSSKFRNLLKTEDVSPKSNGWTFIAESRVDPAKVPRDAMAWGLCVPASCNHSDLEEAINSHLMSYGRDFNNETIFGVKIYEDFCTKKTDVIALTPGEIAFWAFTLLLVLLTATSTITDFLINRKEVKDSGSKLYRIWMTFSVKNNINFILPAKKETTNTLDVFHGIKFASILFILYGHRVGISISLSTMNYDKIEDTLIQDHKMFFVHTDLVVDTFFFISGLLACYIMMDIMTKRFINPIISVMVRATRLAPLYFFLIWFQSTAAFRLGSGPLWKGIAKNETQYCIDNWWANVLFINNYYKSDEMCMPHSWFLPCELHFFALAAVLIPIIIRFTVFGRILLGISTVVAAIIPSVVIYIYKAQPLILFYYEFFIQPRKDESFNLLYIKSHNRAAVYLIGTAVGLFLHHKKNSKTRISKKLTLLGVLAWLAFLFAPMAYGSLYYNQDKTYNAIEAALFGSLRRISWAIGFAIFTLTHRFGTIPFVDFLFSSRLAVFCSRITYGVYLIHYCLITSEELMVRTPRVFSIPHVVVDGIGDIFKSVAATIVLSFILEIPLKKILREILFAKQVKELEKPVEVQNVFTVRL